MQKEEEGKERFTMHGRFYELLYRICNLLYVNISMKRKGEKRKPGRGERDCREKKGRRRRGEERRDEE